MTGLSLRGKASKEHLTETDERIKQMMSEISILQKRIEECERIRKELFDNNVELMKKLIKKKWAKWIKQKISTEQEGLKVH